ERGGNLFADFSTVTGEHNRFFHSGCLQRSNSIFGMRFYKVGNHDMSRIVSADCHMDDGSCATAGLIGDSQMIHKLIITGGYRPAVYHCSHAVSADLLDLGNSGAVEFFSVSLLYAFAYRVGGGTFCKSGVFQKFFFLQFIVMNAVYFKDSLGQCACLVKDYDFCLRKCFKIVGTLYQNAFFAGAADACKKAQRNTDDQCAGAADDQESQGTVDPVFPSGR